MKNKQLFWAARIAALVFAVFISMFILGVFSESHASLMDLIVALCMQLLPALLIFGITLLAWKNEFIGGVIFITMAATFFVFTMGRLSSEGSLIISIPAFVVGVLFIIDWIVNKKMAEKKA